MERASWRDTAALARMLGWALALSAAVQVLSIAFDSGDALVELRPAWDAALEGHLEEANRLADSVSSSTSSVVSIASWLTIVVLVLLAIWSWRSGKNARALQRTGERIAPLLGVFTWFVPFASWVLPYLLVSDLWRSSDPLAAPGAEWRRLPGAVVVRAWWACFAGGQLLMALTLWLALSGRVDAGEADTLLTAVHTVSAVGALLTIVVVREITRRQHLQREADGHQLLAPTLPTGVGTPTPGEAGWYRDPNGAFDLRYWDGDAWTERVRAGEAQQYAPVVPAAWYPDPTGRFPLRYWTGYSWTEHVSRDDELFVDPLV